MSFATQIEIIAFPAKLKRAIPFQPFEIVLSNGTILRVPSPEHLALNEHGTGRIAVLSDDGTFDIVSGSHIVSVHEAEA
jgi:hypothetical protein